MKCQRIQIWYSSKLFHNYIWNEKFIVTNIASLWLGCSAFFSSTANHYFFILLYSLKFCNKTRWVKSCAYLLYSIGRYLISYVIDISMARSVWFGFWNGKKMCVRPVVFPEAEKLKNFLRADFCVQNFPDDKKVHKFKYWHTKKCVNKSLQQRCINEK